MKHSCLCSRILGKVVLSVFSLTFLSVALTAQATTEVQIMVAGPWAYVEDPADSTRVVVVVPVAPHHRDPEIFSGRDVRLYGSHFPESVPTGFYKVDICDATQNSCYAPPSQQKCTDCYPYRLRETVNQTISDPDIKAFLSASNERYAISLPKPNEYTTFCDDSDVHHPDKCPGLSQSIISDQPIKDPGVVPDPHAKDYTTWMVLRYQVSGNLLAWLTGSSDKGTSYDIPRPFLSASGTPAISIVQAPTDPGNTLHCDAYSSESFHHSITKWKLNLYGLFPNLKRPWGWDQDRDHFDYQHCTQQLIDSYLRGETYGDLLNELRIFSDYFGRSYDVSKEQAGENLTKARNSVAVLFSGSSDQVEFKQVERYFEDLGNILARDNEKRAFSAEGKRELSYISMQITIMMAGATDCRMAPISINGVIPQLASDLSVTTGKR